MGDVVFMDLNDCLQDLSKPLCLEFGAEFVLGAVGSEITLRVVFDPDGVGSALGEVLGDTGVGAEYFVDGRLAGYWEGVFGVVAEWLFSNCDFVY